MIKVGCCGFAAAHARYFEALSVVEIQRTFYEPPRPETARRWRDEAPSHFEFTLKAWQLITHQASSPTYRRLRTRLSAGERGEVGAFRWTDPVRRAWAATRRIARLLGAGKVIFQSPARFGPTSENQDRMREFFGSIDREGLLLIWEPRGRWEPAQVRALCRELGLVHCVDPFKGRAVTGGLRYWRLHGLTGYRYRYTREDLLRLRDRIAPRGTTYCMFNNAAMWHNARQFKAMVASTG